MSAVTSMPHVATADERVVGLIHVLSHLTRVRILRVFADADLSADVAGEPRRSRSPKMLADELDEKLENVSYHVRMLVAEGVLVQTGVEPVRGATAHFYRPAGDVEALLRVLDELAVKAGPADA